MKIVDQSFDILSFSEKWHCSRIVFFLPVYGDDTVFPIPTGASNTVLNGEDIITSPKTPKSNRTATIPSVLCDCLREYMTQCFEIQPDDRLFPYGKTYLYRELVRGCEKSGVKKIRVHDIRHSHASALVEMGFSPLLIAERLGHERIQTTMETCSHLYPNKKAEAARQFEDFMSQS